MHKRKLHQILVKIKPISYWYFLAAFIISISVAIVALRDNNLNAIKLRNQLTTVDQRDGDVSLALNNLRKYIYSHMNTNLASGPDSIYPPIQLKYTYQRLLSAEQGSVNATNAQVYTDAENYCQEIIPTGFSGRGRVPCIENYVTTNGVKIQAIPAALYEFDFISPFWSPDLAGWSLIVSVIFLVLFIVRFALEKWLKHNLKQHS
jgi:hypothetical protein